MLKKLFTLIITITLLLNYSATSNAENSPNKGSIGISIDSNSSVTFRKMISDDSAFSVGVKLLTSHANWDEGGDSDSTTTYAFIGYRNYREKGNINYFLDFDLRYRYHEYSSSSSGTPSSTYWSHGVSLAAYYGMEHFLNEHVSLAGRVGIALGYTEYDDNSNSSSLTLPISDIALTYYW